MRTRLASLIAILSIALVAPQAAFAADAQKIADVGFDAVILRPLGAMTVIAGGLMCGPAIVFSGASGQAGVEEAYDIFLAGPWESTVERPLGEF